MQILLVDDHPLFSEGVANLLRQYNENVDILQVPDCEKAFVITNQNPGLDMILLDLSLPGMNGMDGLIRFREIAPTIPVVILSASENNKLIKSALERGAQGFISKSTKPEVILSALRLVMAGDVYIPASYSMQPLANDTAEDPTLVLTKRQREVLLLLIEGKSNKEIAHNFSLSENTVRVHVAAIYKALDVSNRTEAAFVMRNFNLSN